MLVQLTKDVVIQTDQVTHMNSLHGEEVTSIHYIGARASTLVDLPLNEVVRLINEANQQAAMHGGGGWRTEIWTPLLTD